MISLEDLRRNMAREVREATSLDAADFEALYLATLDIAALLDRGELLRRIIGCAIQLLEASGGGVYQLDARETELRPVADWGSAGMLGRRLKVGEGLPGRIVQTQTGIIVEDYSNWPGRHEGSQAAPFRAVVGVPVRLAERIQGVLYVTDHREGRTFNQRDSNLLNLLASHAAIAINNAAKLESRQKRLERDAVWKDISSSASHALGNPIFAMETNLNPLERRIKEGRTEEAIAVLDSIRASVEKTKKIVDRFKLFARTQSIQFKPVQLLSVLSDAKALAESQGVGWEVECPADLYILGDRDRLTECFDELTTNAIYWFDKPDRRISISVVNPPLGPLPPSIADDKAFILIHFRDNGAGILPQQKDRIFDLFFTSRDRGTGIGLAFVRRVIEAHAGAIFETGTSEQGADFEVYLPTAK